MADWTSDDLPDLEGRRIVVSGANTGLGFAAAMGSVLRLWAVRVGNVLFGQDPADGALPMLYAATADDVDGGDYIGPHGFLNVWAAPAKQRSSDRSYDEAVAARLWSVSEELTGVSFDVDALA